MRLFVLPHCLNVETSTETRRTLSIIFVCMSSISFTFGPDMKEKTALANVYIHMPGVSVLLLRSGPEACTVNCCCEKKMCFKLIFLASTKMYVFHIQKTLHYFVILVVLLQQLAVVSCADNSRFLANKLSVD